MRYVNAIPLSIVALLLVFALVVAGCGTDEDSTAGEAPEGEAAEDLTADEKRQLGDEAEVQRAQQRFQSVGLETDASTHSVNLGRLIAGGPPKDGIPALVSPDYVSVAEAPQQDDVRGIMVEFEGERRYYPFNVMVWHEIANDSLGDVHYAITFCPLCGSGIVFDRNVDGQVLEFGVSGLLFESNLVMYYRATESLWSQTLGEAIVGPFTGTRLDLLPMQVLTMEQVKESFPDAMVLSEDTGYNRDYRRNPYGDYEESERVIFPVSGEEDKRFFAKEVFWSFWVEDTAVAFRMDALGERPETTRVNGREIRAERDGGSILVTVDGEEKPGYVEMWFSWVSTHEDDGYVWELE